MIHYTLHGFRVYMLSEVEDVCAAASHHHLAAQCHAGVAIPGPELEVGAPDPGAGLLLQVDPPAVAHSGPVVASTVDEEAALFLPRLYRGHGGPGSANRGVLRYQTFPPTVKNTV